MSLRTERDADRRLLTQIRRLGPADGHAFTALAVHSTMHSLHSAEDRARLLEEAIVTGAFREGTLIGCTCVQIDIRRSYVCGPGQVADLPPANLYLCSTFVHPDVRGQGVGVELYAWRLELAQRLGPRFVAVEILGAGTPYSVDADARPGFTFHRRAGFVVEGYSLEDDRGPVLVMRQGSDVLDRPGIQPGA